MDSSTYSIVPVPRPAAYRYSYTRSFEIRDTGPGSHGDSGILRQGRQGTP